MAGPHPRIFRTFMLAVLLARLLGDGGAQAEEPLSLSCQYEKPDHDQGYWAQTVNFHVDFGAQTVELAQPDGASLASTIGGNVGGLAASVQIGASVIRWTRSNNVGVVFEGTINRETGEAFTTWTARMPNGGLTQWLWSGRCRRAAAKF